MACFLADDRTRAGGRETGIGSPRPPLPQIRWKTEACLALLPGASDQEDSGQWFVTY